MGNEDMDEVKRILSVLRTAMRILGVSNREIERRLGLSPSYLSRLFNGTIELRVEHVLAIARAMGLKPAEFFYLAYPRRAETSSEAAETIRAVLRDLQPAPEPPKGLSVDEVDRRIEQTVRQVLSDFKARA